MSKARGQRKSSNQLKPRKFNNAQGKINLKEIKMNSGFVQRNKLSVLN